MKSKSIGIIGRAGPQAGALLLERVLSLSTQIDGCYKDSKFPKILLISFPFSRMLSTIIDTINLKDELRDCIDYLRKNGASVLAIACNTLHLFLDEKDELGELVHLPRALAEEILPKSKPLIFCTSTSAQFKLHQHYFFCSYPDPQTQAEVDHIIDQILKGKRKI
jgi:aspartate racemase